MAADTYNVLCYANVTPETSLSHYIDNTTYYISDLNISGREGFRLTYIEKYSNINDRNR